MSFLDNVQLAYACPLRWEKLVGGERQRYCGQCERHVHNLSAMTRPEAERLLASGVPVCVRVEVDAQGRAVHRPGLAAAVAVSLLAACGADGADSALDSGLAVDTAVAGDDLVAASQPGDAPIPEVTDQARPLVGRPAVFLGEPVAVETRVGTVPAPRR